MSQAPGSIPEMVQAATRLFHGNAKLTTWQAVERILEDMDTPHLEALYRRSTRKYPWCGVALALGGDHLDTAAIEHIAALMRRDPRIRSDDDRRFVRPVNPSARSQPIRRPRGIPGHHR